MYCGQKASGVVKGKGCGDFVMVRGFRIPLAGQGTQVRSLVRELRSHMPQAAKAYAPQLERSPHRAMIDSIEKSLREAAKTQCSQINKY